MWNNIILFFLMVASTPLLAQNQAPKYRWGKLSTEYGDLERLHKGKIQPALHLADFSKNKKVDIVLAESTESPSVIMYVHVEDRKWEAHTIEKRAISAGASIGSGDIDNDGDLDLIIGSGDGKEIWWWENPYPSLNANRQWKRNYLKRSGTLGHRDLGFGDFDNDGIPEVAFWSENALWIAKRPENPARTDDWPLTKIYSYPDLSQMEQKTMGSELENKGINHHEGIAVADIDHDGTVNLLAGGSWFIYKDMQYIANPIDLGYVGGRITAGQVVPGGWSEALIAPGNGAGPIVLYQLEQGAWKQTIVLKNARRTYSVQIVDFNKDGHADIVGGEMRTIDITDPKVFVLFNDGNNNFTRMDVESGKGAHGLIAGDVDGDGDYDLVGKPYSHGAPRLDIWINNGER
jgi:hypothetical protein